MNESRDGMSRPIALLLCLVLLLINVHVVFADVRLPAVISDNMVLQNKMKAKIWGWAEPGEEIMVSVSWHSMKWAVTADKDGKWMFRMNPPKVGGPYKMVISGKNKITIENILVGEVWIASGQSNMHWPVNKSTNAEQEIASANYPNVRLFTVGQEVAEEPQDDCEGNWTSCSPESVADFSATAYFFGK